jgi:hypothetical protein
MRRRDALPDPEVLRGLHELDAALAAEPTADPDLSQLVADVEAARPEPSAAFLASLDARVHAGFPREARATKAARIPWHARIRRPQILAPGFAVLLVALLVGGVALREGGDGIVTDSGSLSKSIWEPSSSETLSADKQLSGGGTGASSADAGMLTLKSMATIHATRRGRPKEASACSAAQAAPAQHAATMDAWSMKAAITTGPSSWHAV